MLKQSAEVNTGYNTRQQKTQLKSFYSNYIQCFYKLKKKQQVLFFFYYHFNSEEFET